MLAILSPILVFGLVIFVHELGHFIAAKATGVTRCSRDLAQWLVDTAETFVEVLPRYLPEG